MQEQRVSVSAFIRFGVKVLLLRRSSKETFLPGYYELVGGKMNYGEEPLAALVRETGEEAGVEIEVIGPYHVFSYMSLEGKRHTVDISFLCTLKGAGNVVLSDAHDHYAWVEEAEIDQYLMTPEMRVSVQKGFERST